MGGGGFGEAGAVVKKGALTRPRPETRQRPQGNHEAPRQPANDRATPGLPRFAFLGLFALGETPSHLRLGRGW